VNGAAIALETVAPAADRPPGFTLWFTGLSGAGKTTIAGRVGSELERRGATVEHLDGDVIRTHLSNGLGFSKHDRDTNIARIAWVASRLTRLGATVIVSAIAPYAEARYRARVLVEQFGPFVEVYVRASVAECARRDVKGLYAKALAGEVEAFTGVSDPYEPPTDPELVIDTETLDVAESVRLVLTKLAELGLAGSRVPR
jgi:adenylyl-sulfate kinase